MKHLKQDIQKFQFKVQYGICDLQPHHHDHQIVFFKKDEIFTPIEKRYIEQLLTIISTNFE